MAEAGPAFGDEGGVGVGAVDPAVAVADGGGEDLVGEAAEPDRGAAGLDRIGGEVGVGELVEATIVSDAGLAPEGLDDFDGFAGLDVTVVAALEGDPVAEVFGFVPAGAGAEDDAAVGEDVEGSGGFGEVAGVAEGDGADLGAEADAGGQGAEVGEGGPGFEGFVAFGFAFGGADLLGGESGVVFDPEDVEAAVVGDVGEVAEESGAVVVGEAAVEDGGETAADRLIRGGHGSDDLFAEDGG
jgi:hypothetical protein